MMNVVFWDIKTLFILHRRHITSPLQSPESYCYVRFDIFTAATMKNVVSKYQFYTICSMYWYKLHIKWDYTKIFSAAFFCCLVDPNVHHFQVTLNSP
jgi:hypothetical protein